MPNFENTKTLQEVYILYYNNIYKQVRSSAALASRRALRPAINGRPQCSIPSTILSLHKCAYRATSRLSVVLRIKFKGIKVQNNIE